MNSPDNGPAKTPDPPQQTFLKGFLRHLFSYGIPVLVVLLAAAFFKHQMDTRPRAQRRPPAREARLVNAEPIRRTTSPAVIPAMGTVVSARQITLYPEVSGLITSMDPVVLPGGLVREGQVLYEIDRRNYQAVVSQRESELERANLNFKLESGSQTVARKEYSLLEEIVEEEDADLVLRKPHLEEARAALAAAQAALDQARLDVQRCTIRAPFKAVIREKFADLGGRVSPTSPLVSLIGIDEYWVEVLVPVDQIQWIRIPRTNEDSGSAVIIYNPSVWGPQAYREGRVVRLMGHLEEQGRMARLLVTVSDPLGLEDPDRRPTLLIGSYVRAEIQGLPIDDVFPIRREYLRNGNQVWIMNDKGELEIRSAEIVFRGKDTVYIRNGFEDGDQIVTTDLSTAVEGMPLRTEADPAKENGQDPQSTRGSK